MLCLSRRLPRGFGVPLAAALHPYLQRAGRRVRVSSAAPRTARGREGALGPRALQGVLRTSPLQHVRLLQHSSSLKRILCPIFFFHFPGFPFQPEHVQSSPQRRAAVSAERGRKASGWPSARVPCSRRLGHGGVCSIQAALYCFVSFSVGAVLPPHMGSCNSQGKLVRCRNLACVAQGPWMW